MQDSSEKKKFPAASATKKKQPDEGLLSLKELCSALSISIATGRNWIRSGRIIPEYMDKKTPFFTEESVFRLKSEIRSGKNKALKSRRNKKFISGNSFYRSYVSETCKNTAALQKLLSTASQEMVPFTPDIIQYLLADCALHLFFQKQNPDRKSERGLLAKYLRKEFTLPVYGELVDALIETPEQARSFCSEHPLLFQLDYAYEPGEDILGLLYLSCKNMGKRKASGTYYTPTRVVKKLISKLNLSPKGHILDPCCGTGNFLLQLPETVSFHHIYGTDIDSVSVRIARLNMALKYHGLSVELILSHITEKDSLMEPFENSFEHIIGNPPWGYEFSECEKEKLREKYLTASGKTMESYDIFIECALRNLSVGGRLSFVLPESLLNVRSHTTIRKMILETCSIDYLEFLGNVFDGVQCPSVILQLSKTEQPLSTEGMTVCTPGFTETFRTKRHVTAESFCFLATDAQYELLEKLLHTPRAGFLSGNADFALGIVTGDNKRYLSSEKTEENEGILKGTDIEKYQIRPASHYILFKPEQFQQTAPAKIYRAPEKLLYRFISRQLVFAYDDKQLLSLNSCNILIPRLKGAEMKYVLAILNSSVAQFLYQTQFHSVKVLRSHIESIPIPLVDEALQKKIIKLAESLINPTDSDNFSLIYDRLDQLIFDIFDLSKSEQLTLKNAVCPKKEQK